MDRGEDTLGINNGGGGSAKRKIDDEIELAKQKAQAIAARFLNDADSKRPRTGFDSSVPPPQPSFAFSQSSFPVPYATAQATQYNGVPSSKKICIPNSKVGVIIGRGGDMIKNLQQQTGARIQITRDADADPTSLMRDVELVGTQDQINRAEELINEVIAETDAASTGSAGNRSVAPLQPGSEQFVMKVPNDRVALVIGKGGETIKSMQGKTGARIQVVPLHLPPGDTSTERNVHINGTLEQIESVKELINEVISGNRMKGNTYTQPSYPPAGGWTPQGQPPTQQPPAYGYTQPGTYQQPPYYGGYPPQPTSWEQQTTPPAAPPPQQPNTGYNAYGQQTQPTSTPPPTANYGQAAGYNYNYPQQPPYGQDDQTKPYTNPAYGSSVTSTQPETSQPGYGTPAGSGQPDGSTQSQPPPAYATSYNQQPTTAPPAANGYGAYPNYSAAAAPPPAQPTYGQTGYPQMGYAQQQEGQVSNQAYYSYYDQSGYPPAQALPSQSGYYQGGYPPVPPQTQTQAQGVGAGAGDSTAGSGATAAAQEGGQPEN